MRNRLQEIRQHQNLTPTELARKAGVSLKTVLAAEKGRLPRESTRRCLANALHVNVRHIWPSSRTEKKRRHARRVKHCIPTVKHHSNVTSHDSTQDVSTSSDKVAGDVIIGDVVEHGITHSDHADRFLTIGEVANIFRLPESIIHGVIDMIPHLDIGGYIRVSEKWLRNWIESQLTRVR